MNSSRRLIYALESYRRVLELLEKSPPNNTSKRILQLLLARNEVQNAITNGGELRLIS